MQLIRFMKRCRQQKCATSIPATARRSSQAASFERLHGATLTTLLDFQKAQIAFASVMQLVTLIAFNHPAWLGAVTMDQLGLGVGLLRCINTLSIITIALNLMTLRNDKSNGTVPGLVLFASSCSILISFVILPTYVNKNNDTARLQQDGLNPPECGGWNPMQYCTTILDESQTDNSSVVTLFSTLLAVICGTTIEWSVRSPNGRRMARRFGRNDVDGPLSRWARSATLRLGLKIAYMLYELWLFVAGGLSLTKLVNLYRGKEYAFGRKWTLGQILAVSVWIPIIIEWLYLAIGELSSDNETL